LVPVKGQ